MRKARARNTVHDNEWGSKEWNCEDSTMTDCEGCGLPSRAEGSDCSAVDFD